MTNKTVEYTDAPAEIIESFNRSVVIPNFELTPEGIAAFSAERKKKQVSIYLTAGTIDKFKKAAKATGNRYQTMISNALDTYSHYNL